MESARELKISEIATAERNKARMRWLQEACGLEFFSLQAMVGDASSRRYFRVQSQGQSFVLMDAPPQENCHSYVAIAKALRQLGLHAPNVMQTDLKQGFLLITDFGEVTYLSALQADNASTLYHQALNSLAILQSCRVVEGHVVPPFTADFMQNEWALHKEWFLNKLLGLSFSSVEKTLDDCYARVVAVAVSQPQVFMHRDYHSANLMVLPDDEVGLLDFQDAFIGPITYDLVSLLRDCYIDWAPSCVNEWALSYSRRLHQLGILASVEDDTFLRWFDYMGVQRHLKALMTFARKQVRDHQPRYLQHVPRTLQYLLQASQAYAELSPLYDFINDSVQPAFKRMMICDGQ